MNIHNWSDEFEAILKYNNDANDYYYEWTSLDCERYSSFIDMFEQILGVDIHHDVKCKIKTFDGAIFIQKTEDVKT